MQYGQSADGTPAWVDFEYEIDGQMYRFSLPGGEKIALSDLLKVLGIIGDTYGGDKAAFDSVEDFLKEVANVEFSDESLVKVTQIEGDWELESLQPFTTDEELTITMKNGDVVIVKVTDAQISNNLLDFIDAEDPEALTLKINGKTVGSDPSAPTEVRSGDAYELTINFAEINNKVQFVNDGSTMTMPLPNALKNVTGGNTTFTITLSDLDEDGNNYKITGSVSTEGGVLSIHWNVPDENASEWDKTAFNLFKASGNAHFKLQINGTYQHDNGTIEFKTGIERYTKEDENNSLNLNKSGYYDKSSGRMKYTIRVNSEGTNNNVSVHDKLGTALSFDGESGITYTVYNKDGSIARTGTNGTNSGQEFTQSIGNLTNGQYAVVEYSAKVDTTKLTGTGTSEQTGNTVDIPNRDDVQPKTITNQIDWLDISKSAGNATGSGDIKTVPWTITVNADQKGSMGGKTITDTIGYNSRDIMTYADGGITVKVYDGDTQIDSRTLEWNTNTDKGSLVKSTNNNGQETWTYTVPDSDKGHDYKYVITYNTKVDMTGKISGTQVTNNVSSEGKSSGGTQNVGPGNSEVTIEKDVVEGANTNHDTTEWKITIHVPAAGLNSAYLEDYLPNKDGKTMIDVFKDGTYSVTGLINENTEERAIFTDYSSDTNNPRIHIDFQKYVNGEWVSGLMPSSSARDIVVTYQTINNTDWMDKYRAGSGNDSHSNTAQFYVGNQSVQTTETVTPPNPALTKNVVGQDEIEINGSKVPRYKYRLTIYDPTLEQIQQGINITDIHNAKLTFYNAVTSESDQNRIQCFVAENGSAIPFSSNIMHRPNFSDTGNTLSIVADATDLPLKNGQPYRYYYIEYYMVPVNINDLISESIEGIDPETGAPGKVVMDNEAFWGTLHDDETVTYEYKGLSKDIVGQNGRIRKYELIINPGAIMLGDPAPETLTLTDEYENISVDYSTIKVTNVDGSPLPEAIRNKIIWNYSGNKGTFTVPNGTALKITYNARVTGDGQVTYKNTAILGDWKDWEERTETFGSEGSGGAENFKLRLFKYPAGNMTVGLSWAILTLQDKDGNDILYPQDYADPEKAGKPISFTTGSDGYVTVMLDSSDIGFALAKDIVYYLVETNPPAGYEEDYIQYSFEISDNSEYDNKNGVYRYYNNDILKVSNKTEEGGLIIVKSLNGINTNNLTTEEQERIDNITFTISGVFRKQTGVDDDGKPIYSDTETEEKNIVVKYKDFTDGRYRIEPAMLVVGENYIVTESDASVEGYQLVTTYRVDGGTVKTAGSGEGQVGHSDNVSFSAEDIAGTKSHRVTINNKYSTYSYDFTKVEQGTLESGAIGEETELLRGAEFTSYAVSDPETALKTYKTDSYGQFGVRYIDHCYQYNTLYYIWETKAPEGYEMLPESATGEYEGYEGALREKYYFYFSNPDDATPWVPAEGSVPAGKIAYDLSQGDADDSPVIENGKLVEEFTKLRVRKEWKSLNAQGEPGNDISAAQIAKMHPEWVEDGIPFYVYQVSRTTGAYTSDELKAIAAADIANPDERQGQLYVTEENPTGEYKITYDATREFKWQGLVEDDMPLSRTLFGKTTYYGYYVIDEADGFVPVYTYGSTGFSNYRVGDESYPTGHLELWNVQEATDLYVKKVLEGPEQETSRVSDIQFQIYRDPHEGEEGDPDHNGWVLVKTNPETMSMTKDASGEWGYRNQDGSLKAISGLVKGEVYHVVETKVAPDDLPLSVWDVEVSDDNIFHGGETAIISNTYKGKYLSVKKEWDIEGDLPSSITIRVYRREKGSNDAFVKWKEESLNQGNNWEKFWKSNEMELNGKDWEYYVEEVTTGYYSQISATEANPLEVAGTIVVKNSTKYDGEISVNKVWKNKNNGELETGKVPDEVRVILQRAVAEVQGCKVTLNVNLVKGTNTEVITREVTVPEGTQVKFKIEGNGVNEYTGITEWLDEYNHPAGGYVTLTASGNSVSGSVTATTSGRGWESVNVSIENESSLPSVSLNRITDYQDVEGKEITLTKPNWSYTWENLPTDADNNHAYVYSVREISVDGKSPSEAGFVSVVTGQDTNDGTVIVTNKEVAMRSIKVIKNWVTAPPTGSSITVELYKDGEATGKTITLDGTVDSDGETAAWEGTFTVPEDGDLYTVQESGAPSGYTLVYESVENADSTVETRAIWLRTNTVSNGTYVLVENGYAMNGTKSGGDFTSTDISTAVSGDGAMLSASSVIDAIKFTFAGTDGGFTIKHGNEFFGMDPYTQWHRDSSNNNLYISTPTSYKYERYYLSIRSDKTNTSNKAHHPIALYKETEVALSGNVTYTLGNDKTFEPATAELKIIKVDANGMETLLDGAKFELRKINPNNSSLEYLDNIATLPTTTGSDNKTGDDGVAIFSDIEEGYYEVKEAEMPDGYVLTGSGTFYFQVTSDGEVVFVERDSTSDSGWKESTGNAKLVFTSASGNDPATAEVGNDAGVALPSTGGPGTRLFTILGSILILGAGVLLWRRRRLI